jgi:predicted O-methyltransferase YrrM
LRLRRAFFPPEDYSHIDGGLGELLEYLPQPIEEGHSSPAQAEFLYHLVRLVRPQLVVETGLNVGHSAAVVMLAQESVGMPACMMIIDTFAYEETREAAPRLAERFEGFSFVEGDSKVVLSEAVNRLLREREDLRLGLGLVDGGHDCETALHDLEVLWSYLTMGGYLVLDDFEKVIPNAGCNMAGRTFERKWGNCVRFRTGDTRGFMLHQKGF